MLEARIVDFQHNLLSSSMKDSKKGFKCNSSLALELKVMEKFKAFDNIECLVDWFKTQIETTRLKQSTIV
jgi:hypothetical protein